MKLLWFWLSTFEQPSDSQPPDALPPVRAPALQPVHTTEGGAARPREQAAGARVQRLPQGARGREEGQGQVQAEAGGQRRALAEQPRHLLYKSDSLSFPKKRCLGPDSITSPNVSRDRI